MVGSILFSQNIPKLLALSREDLGYTVAIVLLGMLENFCDTMAVKYVSPTKVNVFQSIEVILNYSIQIHLEHHLFHPSDIAGLFLLLIAVNATIFEHKVMDRNLGCINGFK